MFTLFFSRTFCKLNCSISTTTSTTKKTAKKSKKEKEIEVLIINSPAPTGSIKLPEAAAPPAPPPPIDPLIEVFINDKSVKIPGGSVIIQACAAAGIDIPRFCYHEKLGIAGNCRMCLVQVEKMPKMIASCSQPIAPGMRIITDSPQVKKAREGVMEFLLANHPLDCAICDQGGECDLQDQSMAFGSDRSRFNLETEVKRAVEDKDFGPLIKTSMNRCIHCTRCVRFGNEIGGLPELGTTGRGNDMQIGTFVQSLLGSELSANIIDLCPVGALTSKPYAFTARPWELRKTESIDVMDAVGSAIRIDTRGVDLMRIQPRSNESINEEWLADKSRFIWDGLKVQRLTHPMVQGEVATWSRALERSAEFFKNSKKDEIALVAGPFADVETLVSARDLMAKHGLLTNLFTSPSLFDHGIDETIAPNLSCDHISQFRSGLSLQEMEQIDTLLIIGTNLRHEAPLLNARLRKAFLKNEQFSAGVFGCDPNESLNFDFDCLGGDLGALRSIEKLPFWDKMIKAKRPAILISNALISEHPDQSAILENIRMFANNLKKLNSSFINSEWNGLAWIPRSAGHVGARLVGYSRVATSEALKSFKTILMIGSPDTIVTKPNQQLIYIGHHADRLAPISDVILPSAAYTEKSGTFVNLEGRVQRSRAALHPPGEARLEWESIRALSEVIDPSNPLPYDSIEELRQVRIPTIVPGLQSMNSIIPESTEVTQMLLEEGSSSNSNTNIELNYKNVPFSNVKIPDYYMTDVISRASATMAKCSLAFTRKISSDSRDVDKEFNEIINK